MAQEAEAAGPEVALPEAALENQVDFHREVLKATAQEKELLRKVVQAARQKAHEAVPLKKGQSLEAAEAQLQKVAVEEAMPLKEVRSAEGKLYLINSF